MIPIKITALINETFELKPMKPKPVRKQKPRVVVGTTVVGTTVVEVVVDDLGHLLRFDGTSWY